MPPAPPGRWLTDPAGYLADYRERRREEWQAYHRGEPAPPTAEEVDAHFDRLRAPTARCSPTTAAARPGGRRRGLADRPRRPRRPGRPGGRTGRPRLHHPRPAARPARRPRRPGGWEEALLSMRLALHRDPDVFDLTLLSLLRYGHQPAQTRRLVHERTASDETVRRDGLRLQRWCPHAGEDLAHAVIADGVVECPRHHWRWDAATGACLSGGSLPLRVEPEPTEPEAVPVPVPVPALSTEPAEGRIP
ncbi:Rieske (2Fe-2S) protein [Kitasatospora arboriphila]